MNAEQVVDKILSQAKAEADKILTAAKDAADKEKQRLDKELQEYAQTTQKTAETAGQDKLARMLAAARMQNGRQLLGTKGRILDELFARAKQQIEKLPDNEYLELIKRLLQKTVQTGQEEVIVGKNETRINQAFLTKVNTELLWQTKGGLKMSHLREDITGGFILSSGKVRINASTDVIVSQLRDMMDMEFAAQLFQ
jgi:V/A-type H+-transporting ATPase subunit E